MSDQEIRERIRAYVQGKSPAEELEDALEDLTGPFMGVPIGGQRLASDALRLLAEHANGDWTDDELRDLLGKMSRTYWFDSAPKSVIPSAGTAVIHHGRSSAVVGTPHVAESV